MERALVDGKRGRQVIAGLETLAQSGPENDPDALFAHRQLAELQLEDSPWRAALHLRQLLRADAADDGVHALMGLCQALLGNFRAAVGAYRRAVRRSPRNPWYHHNLGHLLDVGEGESGEAERHLRIAHGLEPDEDEITASLAHCLARVGKLAEATELARAALAGCPQNDEHRALLAWIEEGAPERKAGSGRSASPGGPRAGLPAGARHAGASRSRAPVTRFVDPNCLSGEGTLQVAQLIADQMASGGCSDDYIGRALALWVDFCEGRDLRVAKPAVYAAAIEYAIAKLDRVRGVTQAGLAESYGVAPGSVSNRYGEIRATLELIPGDPRYRASR